MIIVVRISGKVKIRKEIEETFFRLRLRKKYTCTLIDEKNKIEMGMLKKIKDYVAFGEIDKGTLIRLIEKRGKKVGEGEVKDAEKIATEILAGKFKEAKIKRYFRLHPPRKGLKSSKKQFPRGILGNHKQEINKLIERML